MYYTIYEGKYAGQKDSDLRVYGHNTNTATRPLMITELISFILEKYREIPCKDLIQEITLLEEKNQKIQASKGSHDDLTLALAQALYILIHEVEIVKKLIFSSKARQYGTSKLNILNSRKELDSISFDKTIKAQTEERDSTLANYHSEQFEQFKNNRKTIKGMFSNLNG